MPNTSPRPKSRLRTTRNGRQGVKLGDKLGNGHDRHLAQDG
jgi:hypothetical protein